METNDKILAELELINKRLAVLEIKKLGQIHPNERSEDPMGQMQQSIDILIKESARLHFKLDEILKGIPRNVIQRTPQVDTAEVLKAHTNLVDKNTLYSKFSEYAVSDAVASAINKKSVKGIDSAVLLGFKPGCGACTEVLRELEGQKLDKNLFATISPSSIYFDKIMATHNIKGNPFLLVISNGKIAPPVVGWQLVQIVKTVLKIDKPD